MNKSEQRAHRKLQIRIEELERHFKIAQESKIDTFRAMYENRAALKIAYDGICEIERDLRGVLESDSDFVPLARRVDIKTVEPDF